MSYAALCHTSHVRLKDVHGLQCFVLTHSDGSELFFFHSVYS